MEPQKNPSQSQKPTGYVFRSQQLPETQEPSPDNNLSFFKVKQRLNEDFFAIRIGLLVSQFSQFQEDFVTYLANTLMCESDFLNIFIVDDRRLYISMNASSEPTATGEFEYLELQSDIYFLLDFCRNTLVAFFSEWLSEKSIFESNINSEDILAKFDKLCVKPINEMYVKVFNRNRD